MLIRVWGQWGDNDECAPCSTTADGCDQRASGGAFDILAGRVEAERFILIAPDGANDADGEQVSPFFFVRMSGMRKIMTRSVA